MEIWTIKRLLEWITEYLTGKGVDSPRLCAELLLCHVLGMQRIELYVHFDKAVQKPQLDALRDLVKRAGQHEPVAYLVGRWEFYSLSFQVSPDCLIPRPETELLVERAIQFLRKRPAPYQVLDICAGSGCIAAAIAKNVPQAQVVASDICDKALSIAAANVQALGVADRVRLLRGDVYDPIVAELDAPAFDAIVANPPYVSDAEFAALAKNVKDYEPAVALRGGKDGLDVCRKIVRRAAEFLKPDGALFLEIGFSQGAAVRKLLSEQGDFSEIHIEKDLNKIERIAIAKKAA